MSDEPENKDRAEWAGKAIAAFRRATGADEGDAVCDLLANLGHWCDLKNGHGDFDAQLRRAAFHYEDETEGGKLCALAGEYGPESDPTTRAGIAAAVKTLASHNRGVRILKLLQQIYSPGGALNLDAASVRAWRTIVNSAPGSFNDTVPTLINNELEK